MDREYKLPVDKQKFQKLVSDEYYDLEDALSNGIIDLHDLISLLASVSVAVNLMFDEITTSDGELVFSDKLGEEYGN